MCNENDGDELIPSGRWFCQIWCAAIAVDMIDGCSSLTKRTNLTFQSSIFTVTVDFICIQTAQSTHTFWACNGRWWWHWHMLSWHWMVCVFMFWTNTDAATATTTTTVTACSCRWWCTFICFLGRFTRQTSWSNDHCPCDHSTRSQNQRKTQLLNIEMVYALPIFVNVEMEIAHITNMYGMMNKLFEIFQTPCTAPHIFHARKFYISWYIICSMHSNYATVNLPLDKTLKYPYSNLVVFQFHNRMFA